MEKEALKERGEALFAAVRSENTQPLAQLLEAHPALHLTARDEEGNTALHEAVRCGALLAAGYLLDAGADANAINDNEDRPVHIAASSGDLACTKLLVAHGAKVFHLNDCGREDRFLGAGYSPLMLAASKGHEAVFDFLYETEIAQLGYTVGHGRILECAAYGGNEAIIAQILAKEPKVLESMWGRGALGAAVCQGNLPAVVQLIAGGADVNAIPYYDDAPPLLSAACLEDLEIGMHLLRHGADINARNEEGAGVLHLAAGNETKGQRAFLKLAIERGAEVNQRNHYGSTPLHIAACHPSLAGVKVLLQAGADPRIGNKEGKTPLEVILSESHQLYPPSPALVAALKPNKPALDSSKATSEHRNMEM